MRLGRELRLIQVEPEPMPTAADQPIRSQQSQRWVASKAQSVMSIKAIRDQTSENSR